MTLGNVYDLDLKKNESKIKDVIIQAQGEVRLLLLPLVLSIYRHTDGS
jgi:sporulation protein YlmC with PRC-barrel domain